MKDVLRKYGPRSLLYIATFILFSLIFRNVLLSYYLDRKIASFNKTYGAELVVESARIRWLSSLRITGISLSPAGGDTLIRIDTATAQLSFFRMVTGRIALSNFELRNTHISFIRNDTVTNYMFLLERTPRRGRSDSVAGRVNYGERISRIFEAVFEKIPDRLVITDFLVTATSDAHYVGLRVDRFSIEDHGFRFPVMVEEDTATSEWIIEGTLDKHERKVNAKMYPAKTGQVSIPFIRYRWNAGLSFDTLKFSLYNTTGPDGQTITEGLAGVTGLTLDHPQIAAQPVVFRELGIGYRIIAGSDFIELDSSTRITFDRLAFNPYIRYQKNTSSRISFRIHAPWFPAQDLFSSLPEGLFTVVTGMQVAGDLKYDMDFFVDLSVPDSLRFESDLQRREFRIRSYGPANLTRLDSSFEYTAYDRDLPVRTFMVGPENPMFRSLDRIPPYLRYSVLTAEDGGFYQHRGFLIESIRESIAANIRERRFARGGSTVTMQLVKNVFLSRSKTIARKLEEMLIVWLIENQQLCTKDRMFEVYLNIIEWGPMVYGANEASRFYFNKDVSRLTYAESIFLASIVPKPKWFRSSFDSAGHLRPDMADYYRLVSGKMLAKGWVAQRDVDELVPDVELKGPAKEMLHRKDSLVSFRPRLIQQAPGRVQ